MKSWLHCKHIALPAQGTSKHPAHSYWVGVLLKVNCTPLPMLLQLSCIHLATQDKLGCANLEQRLYAAESNSSYWTVPGSQYWHENSITLNLQSEPRERETGREWKTGTLWKRGDSWRGKAKEETWGKKIISGLHLLLPAPLRQEHLLRKASVNMTMWWPEQTASVV